MISFEQARTIALELLLEIEKKSNIKLALLDDETVTFEHGWVFFYQSSVFVRTGDINSLVGGNAPIIIDKSDGIGYLTGTGKDMQYYIERFDLFKKGIISKDDIAW